MAKTGDVEFIYPPITPTETYDYMLAQDANGQKAWQVRQLFMQAPSLIKDKIDLTILAAPQMRQADGTVIATRTISTVLTELRSLTDKTAVIKLDGLDGISTYRVLFDQTATNAKTILDPTGRITQYEIDLSCWNLYQ